MNLNIKSVAPEQINIIKPLWEELNKIHLHDSKNFKSHFKEFTFERRCEFLSKIDTDNIKIYVLFDNKKPVGYCLSTIRNNTGELDSLFILKDYRKNGHGEDLVEKSLKWFNEKNCSKIQTSVADGHESVIEFYKRFNFFPRKTVLEKK